MKVCPTCRCQYEDALSFCKRDGSPLVMLEKTGYCKKCESRYPLGLERCPLHGQPLALEGPETVTGLNYCLICSNDYPKDFKLCPLHGTVLQALPPLSRDTTEVPQLDEPPSVSTHSQEPIPRNPAGETAGSPKVEMEFRSRSREESPQYSTAGREFRPSTALPLTAPAELVQSRRAEPATASVAVSPFAALIMHRGEAKGFSFPVAVGIAAVILLVTVALALSPRMQSRETSVAQQIPSSTPTGPPDVLSPSRHPEGQPGSAQKAATRSPQNRGSRLLGATDALSAPVNVQPDSSRSINLAEVRTISNRPATLPVSSPLSVPPAPVPPFTGLPELSAQIGVASEPQSQNGAKISAAIQNPRRTAIRHGFRYEFDIVLRETNGIGIGSRDTTLRWVSDSGSSGRSRVITPERFAPASAETYHITVELLGTAGGFWRGIAYYDGIGIDETGHPVRLSLSLRLDDSFIADVRIISSP